MTCHGGYRGANVEDQNAGGREPTDRQKPKTECSWEQFWIDGSLAVSFLEDMIATKSRWCWRKDLAGFRGLSDRDRAGFLILLEWMENFRLRHELEAGREASKVFWRSEVLREGGKREGWQLDQWGAAIQWYLNWLGACAEAGADHRSLAERLRAAVHAAGSRRGLARRTKQC